MTVGEEEIKIYKQVKCKKRITNYGEVYTADREVNAMLDLVKQETERIDSRFLEPACGNGNFLAEVLRRKLAVISSKYSKSQLEWERNAVIATSSIYGVDILKDNTWECRARLFRLFDERYSALFKNRCKQICRKTVGFILEKNIIWGNALNFTNPVSREPIIFSEWSPIGGKIKRRDFLYEELINNDNSLFNQGVKSLETGQTVFFPKHVKTYLFVDMFELLLYD